MKKVCSANIYNISLKTNFIIILILCITASCTHIDLFEKNIAIPQQKWSNSFKPEFKFEIKDTTTYYQLYLILRHNEKYNYNNLWINLYVQPPGDTAHKSSFELPLATNEKGWLGSSMDDIYEHRIKLINPLKMKAGEYKFKIEQIMREDPLLNVLNIGLRVEKHPFQ